MLLNIKDLDFMFFGKSFHYCNSEKTGFCSVFNTFKRCNVEGDVKFERFVCPQPELADKFLKELNKISADQCAVMAALHDDQKLSASYYRLWYWTLLTALFAVVLLYNLIYGAEDVLKTIHGTDAQLLAGSMVIVVLSLCYSIFFLCLTDSPPVSLIFRLCVLGLLGYCLYLLQKKLEIADIKLIFLLGFCVNILLGFLASLRFYRRIKEDCDSQAARITRVSCYILFFLLIQLWPNDPAFLDIGNKLQSDKVDDLIKKSLSSRKLSQNSVKYCLLLIWISCATSLAILSSNSSLDCTFEVTVNSLKIQTSQDSISELKQRCWLALMDKSAAKTSEDKQNPSSPQDLPSADSPE